ncbi:MAG: WYL domain-containing protein [Halomonadaceae bacterium]|nr:MAG: WYL domain-containing protein [Halomonadaceae bacterium]
MSTTSLRYLSMLRLIPRHPRSISAPELKNKLTDAGYTVNLRTVQRDLESLSVEFPLTADETSRPFLWAFNESATVNMIPALDVPEALTLELARAYLTPVLPQRALSHLQPHFREAQQTLQRPNTVMGKWPDRVRVINRGLMSTRPTVNDEVLQQVTEALLRDYQCDLLYRGRGRDETETMRVHPLGMIFRDPNVYLVCTVEGRDGVRQLALHRAEGSTLVEERSVRPKDFDLDLYIRSGAMGILHSPDPLFLRLRCDRPYLSHLLESPLGLDQLMTETTQDGFEISVTVGDTQDLRWWLVAQAAHLDIVEPAWLREVVVQELSMALERQKR